MRLPGRPSTWWIAGLFLAALAAYLLVQPAAEPASQREPSGVTATTRPPTATVQPQRWSVPRWAA
jgi:hypothetical protein